MDKAQTGQFDCEVRPGAWVRVQFHRAENGQPASFEVVDAWHGSGGTSASEAMDAFGVDLMSSFEGKITKHYQTHEEM